jgi:hypothetical protein
MAGLLDSVMQPGPTIAADRERRASKGSRGLLAALGGPMAYAPNPVVSALGNALLGAQFVTGEADPYEGARSLSDMTAMAVGSRLPAPLRNIITYHGSPHKFDKFDSSKIGTGEGAQAYGHGLYLADTTDVAKTYRASDWYPQGVKTKPGTPEDGAAAVVAQAMDAGHANPYEWAKAEVKRMGGPVMADKLRAIDGWQSSGVKFEHGGNLYKVDLPDSAVAKMLDWDKPLSQQAPEVRAIADKIGTSANLPGRALHNQAQLKVNLGDGPLAPSVADWLRKQGIPGIRYLDGGSRGGNFDQWIVTSPSGMARQFATEAEAKKAAEYVGGTIIAPKATRNYVVFPGEEGLLSILERNGQSLR